MPAGGKVDRTIKKIMASGKSKASAIAIAKSRGIIRQSGKNLVSGSGRKKG